jgi:hypothetical protein
MGERREIPENPSRPIDWRLMTIPYDRVQT